MTRRSLFRRRCLGSCRLAHIFLLGLLHFFALQAFLYAFPPEVLLLIEQR